MLRQAQPLPSVLPPRASGCGGLQRPLPFRQDSGYFQEGLRPPHLGLLAAPSTTPPTGALGSQWALSTEASRRAPSCRGCVTGCELPTFACSLGTCYKPRHSGGQGDLVAQCHQGSRAQGPLRASEGCDKCAARAAGWNGLPRLVLICSRAAAGADLGRTCELWRGFRQCRHPSPTSWSRPPLWRGPSHWHTCSVSDSRCP